MTADTIGMFMERAGSSPRLNFVTGVLNDVLGGMQSGEE
jgi:hypothetical protein